MPIVGIWVGAGFTPAHFNFQISKQPFATNDLYAPTMSETDATAVGAGLAPAQNETFTPAQNETFTPAQNGDNTEYNIPAQNGSVNQNQNETVIHAQYGSDSQNGSDDDKGAGASPAPTVGASVSDIVGAYKSLVANGCLDIWKLKWAEVNPAPTLGKIWQRDYYEHIIRNEQSYETISNYIIDNPAKWNEDKFYTAQWSLD